MLPDQQNTQPPLNPQITKNGLRKGSGILQVGVVGILSVGIAIMLFFGLLNYFNILSLSKLYPKQFGFLPHRMVPQLTPTQSPNYSQTVFQYDVEKAKTIISKYIKDTIKPEFIPQALDIKQGLSIDNRVEDNKRQFGSYFTTSQATFSINFHYKENANTANDFTIFIQPSNVDETTVTQDIANSLTSTYFNNPYSPVDSCETRGTTSYCEEFKTETGGKRGYGVVFAEDTSVSPPKFTPIVFTCFIPDESKDYNITQSCISL